MIPRKNLAWDHYMLYSKSDIELKRVKSDFKSLWSKNRSQQWIRFQQWFRVLEVNSELGFQQGFRVFESYKGRVIDLIHHYADYDLSLRREAHLKRYSSVDSRRKTPVGWFRCWETHPSHREDHSGLPSFFNSSYTGSSSKGALIRVRA